MPLSPGDVAPWFRAPTVSTSEFNFEAAAGRFVLMLFLPVEPELRVAALRALAAHQPLFNDVTATAFVVVRDAETGQTARDLRGLRWFLDPDGEVSRLFEADRPHWLLLDPTLRVIAAAAIHAPERILAALAERPDPAFHTGSEVPAPVLVAPRIFEPELCGRLIALHAEQERDFTGVMRDAGDRTVRVMDDLKKRRDFLIQDETLQQEIRQRLERRLFPLIRRAFSFTPTHIERYLVSCYDAADGGVFHPHRDDTTLATAHRKFACSLNLNGDFEGGDLRFAEFSRTTYRPPVGGAVVFGCGLMHEATRVTAGRRYAFLPFFHDDAGAQMLEAYETRAATRAPK